MTELITAIVPYISPAANPYTATGNYTSTEIYVRYPVNQIWGINTKY